MRISDWSSDVCSSDLAPQWYLGVDPCAQSAGGGAGRAPDAGGQGQRVRPLGKPGGLRGTRAVVDRIGAALGRFSRDAGGLDRAPANATVRAIDRKSTRLNSSH